MAGSEPTTEAQAFDIYDNELKLDPDERQDAVDCQNHIGQTLDAEAYVTGHFLQGSLARKTMIKPLRDIDMVVLLSERMAKRFVGTVIAKEARATAGAAGGPTAAILELQAALTPHFPNARFEIGKHALTIDFGNGGFKFDVVPAIDAGDDVFIANTETEGWERSNTRQLIRTVAERNQSCNGRFVRVVRMIKHCVKHDAIIGDEFFGLLSESIVYDAVAGSLPHAEACLLAFEGGAALLGGDTILDPTGEDNLLRKLPAQVKADAQTRFIDWAARAGEARRLADAGDHAAAIDIWHGIFGDAFPEASPQTTLEAARAWQGGAPTSAGRVSVAVAGREAARPGRSWRSA